LSVLSISSQQSTHQQPAPSRRRRYSHPRVHRRRTDLSVNVRVASSTDARDIVRLACEKAYLADSCCLFETMETLASGSDHVTTSDQCETDTMESDVADELARAWASESSGMSYYATRMRFRLREYPASAWPVFYGQDNILVERKSYTNVRAEYCGPRTPASKLASCLATLDGHELILTPSGGRLAALPGIQKLQSLGQGHMLSPVRLGLADHYLFYGADLRSHFFQIPLHCLIRTSFQKKTEFQAARPFGSRRETLPSLHPGVTSRRPGRGGADVGGSGGFLGHTIVFPKKEEDQFKPFFTQAMRILDELGRSCCIRCRDGIRHPKEKSERSANKTMATVPAAVPSDRVNLRLLLVSGSSPLLLVQSGRLRARRLQTLSIITGLKTGRKPNGQPPTFCASSIRAGFCTAALLWPLCDCPRAAHRYAFSCQGLCSRAARR
uniref:PseudoU_synth_2 domain-containing protein n=1 Tax=Macrostomum lignano TaxID=282301 RepID=A0A1I8JSD4_9PLAT